QDFYLNLLMDEHRLAPAVGHDRAAFEASERARARSLVETLGEARADPNRSVPPALIERERDLRAQLDNQALEQTRLSDKKDDAPKAEAIAQEIRRLIAEHELIRWKIQTANPRETALAQLQPFKTEEIQLLLDADSLQLEYALGAERSYLFALTDKAFQSYELPKREIIETAARRYYELLTARNRQIKFEEAAQRARRLQQADKDLAVAGVELSRMILQPVAAELRQRRLLIVADGALQYVPFAALPATGGLGDGESGGKRTPRPVAPSLRRPVPLIANHEVVHLPSASALAVLRRELKDRKPAPKLLAVLADPVFDADDERLPKEARERLARERQAPALAKENPAALATDELTRAVQSTGLEGERGSLARLPYTRAEAQAILALAPQTQSFGAFDFAANQAAAIDPSLSQYRYVHFATHGLLNDTHPELSGLVLSLVDREGRTQDGFLRMVEVFNLNLPAELVVLSGCKTGLGKEIRGEGLVGLTRGFMHAGAARVLVSLWDVNDRATAELMARVYRGMLGKGLRPAAALRAAQLELSKQPQWRAPYYWASFVLMGESQ
ncbi:MAG: CHAT domain-containing protein, partial [Blastocatellia bacterium]